MRSRLNKPTTPYPMEKPDTAITAKGYYPARPKPPRPLQPPGNTSTARQPSQPDILDRIKALALRFIDWFNDWLYLGYPPGYEAKPGSPYYDDKRKGMSRTRLFSQFRFHGDVFTLLAYDPVKDQYSATCSSDSQKYYFSYRFFDTDLDWVNDGEQMATRAELFDEVEGGPPPPPPPNYPPGFDLIPRR